MSKRDLKLGQEIAMAYIPALKECEARCDDPVHFYAGLFMAMIGICVGAVGAEVTQVLEIAGKDIGAQVAKETQQ